MSGAGTAGAAHAPIRVRGLLAAAACSLLAAGCSSSETAQSLLAMAQAPSLTEAANPPSPDGRTELQKATEYWGKAYAKNPKDAQAAINFAKNLKALGEKQQALAVLQQASVFHGTNRALNAEYGRLALEFDQISVAQKLLQQADDPARPDWRVISARGTVLAKQGIYRDAIAFYERARAVAPNEPSILNNLALAHAMLGEPEKAEPLLKQAAALGDHNQRVSQNLALVLGLQGKYDEAKLAAARDLPAENAAANVDYVRSLVKLEPKPLMTAATEKATAAAKFEAPPDETGWTTKVAVTKPGR
ncbi:MAG TPA: tetratricopeptide repeat protein [Hyphomicrobiaceae bacterium]|nr:tetratricopeptide repeat protein [Hyphomicrobiaceae bacterium]